MLPGTWSPAKRLSLQFRAPVRCARSAGRAAAGRSRGSGSRNARQPAGRRYRCSYQYSRPPDEIQMVDSWRPGPSAGGGSGLLAAQACGGAGCRPRFDASAAPVPAFSSPAAKNTALLSALKEELFALESEKLSGTLKPEEYAEAKAALETVLKRALNRK